MARRLSGSGRRRLRVTSIMMIVTEHLDDIGALCRRYGVRRLDLFGSAATGAFDPATSDLDFVAAFADTRRS